MQGSSRPLTARGRGAGQMGRGIIAARGRVGVRRRGGQTASGHAEGAVRPSAPERRGASPTRLRR
eukprot:4573451-Alexandrium_andersonii.AAC.1